MYQVTVTPMQAHINNGQVQTSTFPTWFGAYSFFANVCNERGYEFAPYGDDGAADAGTALDINAGGIGHDYRIELTCED